jgi:hypothetical protein
LIACLSQPTIPKLSQIEPASVFLDTITAMPLPAAPSQAEAAIEQWLARVKAIAETQPDAPARLSALLDTAKGNAFIQGLFGCSTFLATVVAQQPLFSLDLFEQGPDSGCAGDSGRRCFGPLDG